MNMKALILHSVRAFFIFNAVKYAIRYLFVQSSL
jgi:hypothetical protein